VRWSRRTPPPVGSQRRSTVTGPPQPRLAGPTAAEPVAERTVVVREIP